MISYDSSPAALFFPQTRPTVFGTGPIPSEDALAIEAARLTYLPFETDPSARAALTAALRSAGFEKPTTFNDRASIPVGFFTDSQGFAAIRKTDGLAVLAFRGTQPTRPQDILLDLDFLMAASPHWPGRVHHGFARAAEALWLDVDAWLDGEGVARQSLLVCGHSLGAAIATLIAMRANGDRLITFGTPRIGDRAFVDALQAMPLESKRIVDSIDIVTQIPPTFLDYCHPDDGAFIDANGHIVAHPGSTLTDRDVDAALLFHLAVGPIGALPPALSDHATVNYLRAYWP